jgi:hypothetical protein
MTPRHVYALTTEQTTTWQEGCWSAYRIEEDVIEDLERQRVYGAVVVTQATGELAFIVVPERTWQ